MLELSHIDLKTNPYYVKSHFIKHKLTIRECKITKRQKAYTNMNSRTINCKRQDKEVYG